MVNQLHIELSGQKGSGKTTAAHIIGFIFEQKGAKVKCIDDIGAISSFRDMAEINLDELEVFMHTSET